MDEFGLDEAKWKEGDNVIEFSRVPKQAKNYVVGTVDPSASTAQKPSIERSKPKPSGQSKSTGTPISSPMTGIYYSAASPGSPPFVKEGDTIQAGQTVGLIEAMKVFNEITATISGKVVKVVAESGQLVQPGDPLIYVG